MDKNKRKGSRPKGEQELAEPVRLHETGYPVLSLRHLRKGFDADAMSHAQCAAFLQKWAKRSAFTWTELGTHEKHGLGYEMLPSRQFRPRPPESLRQDKYMVFRHEGNHAFAGFKIADVFYVMWVEAKYGDLYRH